MTAPWYVPLDAEPRETAEIRLFGFPHAGSGPGALAELAACLPATVEPWSVNLPGRQSRLQEPPRTDLPSLVRDLADGIGAFTARPFALFGYCGGALLSYLVASELAERSAPPQHLIVASAAAPDVGAQPRRMHRLPAQTFWTEIIAQGGVAPELETKPELRPVFEPALRADLALLAGYRHTPHTPLATAITVLHGQSDPSIGRAGWLGWRRYSVHPLTLRSLPGSHWLIEENPAMVAKEITTAISKSAADG